MRALVGRFMSGGRAFRARPVDHEGQPTWLLGQLQALTCGVDQEERSALIELLLSEDWNLIACTDWPIVLTDHKPGVWRYVCGVGRAYRRGTGNEPRRQRLADRPDAGVGWAYLWDTGGAALHVYAAAHDQWHHVATLDPDVLATATMRTAIEIQQRRSWVPEKTR